MTSSTRPCGALMVETGKVDGAPFWAAKWRHSATQKKLRLGPAWIERDDPAKPYTGKRRRTCADGWIVKTGACAGGFLTESAARDEMRAIIHEYADVQEASAARAVPLAAVRFDDAADAWLRYVEDIKGAKASTMRDYRIMLRLADGGKGKPSRARIMRAFGGRPLADITTADVAAFLRAMDRDVAVSPRTTNKHRQMLQSIFGHAMRADAAFGLPSNPVLGTEKRREPDPAEIVTYTREQVAAIARVASAGGHRRPLRGVVAELSTGEVLARRGEDEQDAAIITVAALCGLRLGELLALRWRHVMWDAERIHVQLSYSAGVESSTKGRRARTVPLAKQPAQALARLSQRQHFTNPRDLVFCSRAGTYLDGSAVRRRYKAARDRVIADDADMPALRLHDLRHAFGTLAASGFDLVNVQAMMGHADSRTTARYLHARPAAEDAAKLSAIFGAGVVETQDEAVV